MVIYGEYGYEQIKRQKKSGTNTRKYTFKTMVAYICYTEAAHCVTESRSVRLPTCYVYVIFLFQYLLEIRYFELHVCWRQPWKIHFNITHKMWKLPVLLKKKNKSLRVRFHNVFLPLKWLKLIKQKCSIFKPPLLDFLTLNLTDLLKIEYLIYIRYYNIIFTSTPCNCIKCV